MEKLKTLKFETITSNYEIASTEFMCVKVHVCYAGKNRNRSIIERDVLDKMAQTVYGVPVVGEIDKEQMKFKGHGGKLEISDDGFEFIDTTIPYGFVDPTTPFTYETIVENDGFTKNEYLTVKCWLWKGKFPELVEIFENETVKQSMEIYVDKGEWDDNYDYFNIEEAHFKGLCLLGVEPCFESSKATIGYSLSESESLYAEMMDKFKQFTLDTTGGEVVQDEQKLVKDEEVVETEEQAEVEVEEVTTEPVVEEDETDEPEQEVSTDEESEVEEVVEEVVDYKALLENAEVEYGKTIAELNNDKKALEDKVYSLEQELSSLREFKLAVEVEERKQGEEELCAKFTEIANTDEFKQLFSNASSYSLEELDDKCYAILGRMAKSKKQPKQLQTKLPISKPTSSVKKQDNRYGGLLVK